MNEKTIQAAVEAAMKACGAAANWSAKTFESGEPRSSSFALLTAGVALCGVGLMLNAYASMTRR